MRTTTRLTTLVLLVACVGSVAAVAGAAGAAPELAVSDLFTGPGHLTKLRARVTYQASNLPVRLHVTPPDSSWSGAQWKANNFSPEEIERRHLKCPFACRPPYFGWVAVGQVVRSGNVPPQGLVLITTAYDRTPSVAATVDNLRTRGRGATYGPTASVRVAGFSGVEFDGEVVGPSHVFIPFSPRTTKATGFPDAIEMEGAGHAFRFIVLNVRGKTVVIQISSVVLPTERFPDFVAKAEEVVESLRFPA